MTPLPPAAHPIGAEILDAFRQLGGLAENVALADNPPRAQLMAADAGRPFLVGTPENLLVATDDIEFADERIRIRQSAAVPQAERVFFEAYANAFSWTAAVQSELTRFVEAMDALPREARIVLNADLGLFGFFEGDQTARTRKRYLESRSIHWKGKRRIAPLLELTTPGAEGAALAHIAGRLQLQGQAQNGVILRRSTEDAFGLFSKSGIASPQRRAYSLPMKKKVGDTNLRVERYISTQAKRAGVNFPDAKRVRKTVIVSCVAIGDVKGPRLPRGIFRTIMEETGIGNADEIFDFILNSNRRKFLKLLRSIESHEGELIRTLRKMARYQLDAMSHCIGATATS